MNNLHISYDLFAPGQDYNEVIDKIKKLGNWAKVNKSFWFVKSHYSAREAMIYLRPSVDKNDSLYIVDSKNNEAIWHNIPDEVAEFISANWNMKQSV